MNRIIKIILIDILKSKIVLAYTFILAILSWSSFALEDNSAKGILTILNVILFTVAFGFNTFCYDLFIQQFRIYRAFIKSTNQTKKNMDKLVSRTFHLNDSCIFLLEPEFRYS